jgi:dihydroflavonol-4-reductase
VVGVEDCAAGHILAHDRGRRGESYILGGEDMTLLEIFRALASITGIPAPTTRIPRAILGPIALACETWSRVSGRPPRISREAVSLGGRRMYFTSAKAERELGYRPGPAAEALARAVRWFEEKGFVPGRLACTCQSAGGE